MNKKFGIIGFGKMGEALYKGFLKNSLLSSDNVIFFEKDEVRRAQVENEFNIIPQELDILIKESDIVLFCIKPHEIKELLKKITKADFSQKLFISILAGTKISVFEHYLGQSAQIVRAMPNTPVLLGQGMSAICFNTKVILEKQSICEKLFQAIGRIIIIKEESMDAVTGISGSGPAFLYRIAQEIAKIGISEGLSKQESITLIAQTMVGAGEMLLNSGKDPEELIKDVASPKGTTAAGLEAFNNSHIDKDITDVIKRAIERSKEL